MDVQDILKAKAIYYGQHDYHPRIITMSPSSFNLLKREAGKENYIISVNRILMFGMDVKFEAKKDFELSGGKKWY